MKKMVMTFFISIIYVTSSQRPRDLSQSDQGAGVPLVGYKMPSVVQRCIVFIFRDFFAYLSMY